MQCQQVSDCAYGCSTAHIAEHFHHEKSRGGRPKCCICVERELPLAELCTESVWQSSFGRRDPDLLNEVSLRAIQGLAEDVGQLKQRFAAFNSLKSGPPFFLDFFPYHCFHINGLLEAAGARILAEQELLRPQVFDGIP